MQRRPHHQRVVAHRRCFTSSMSRVASVFAVSFFSCEKANHIDPAPPGPFQQSNSFRFVARNFRIMCIVHCALAIDRVDRFQIRLIYFLVAEYAQLTRLTVFLDSRVQRICFCHLSFNNNRDAVCQILIFSTSENVVVFFRWDSVSHRFAFILLMHTLAVCHRLRQQQFACLFVWFGLFVFSFLLCARERFVHFSLFTLNSVLWLLNYDDQFPLCFMSTVELHLPERNGYARNTHITIS